MLKDKPFFKTMPIFLCLSLALVGLFHEYMSCIAAIFLLVYFLFLCHKNGEIKLRKNLTGLALTVIPLFYLLSCLWAVDSSMAFIGFLKFLPLPLFWLVLNQREEGGEEMLICLPYSVAALSLFAAIGMQIPPIVNFFSVAGRFAGTFQYPNTFALLILVSFLVLLTRGNYKTVDYITLPFLLLALLYTGSRTVLVLAALSSVAVLFVDKNRKIKIIVLCLLAAAAVLVGAVLLFAPDSTIASRILSISFSESTFVGRLLYFRDALPIILKHPFGLGYLGYYYIEQSIQTGVYSVRYIHNDFLQILLDIGFVPFLALLAAIISSFASKKKSLSQKLILLTFILHTCFDFNLQYVSMFFVFILLLDCFGGEEKKIGISSKKVLTTVCILISLLLMYMGIALACGRFGAINFADKLYPNTQNDTKILSSVEDIEFQNSVAEKILERNEKYAHAYSIKSRYFYSKGNFKNLMENKRKVISLEPFNTAEYSEYAYMLINGIKLYEKAGDEYSVKICKQELLWIRDELSKLPSRQSRLGKLIKDQPKTQLPEDIEKYIKQKVEGRV